ncbi:MAG: hypothetical protein KatS3mg055_1194 [Chloroflexus sp.]|uniref:hypothetical protein n=1 Tax=Chloroflexus sp. TaxID=1904827 RepID=UPI0021DBCD9D|nr:hypothetical protein [Chloroflexus sp.]GIV88676.1 MAG: hypothetical protein KatS3mg055_1194 [Chloroflexus sp.]
MRRLLMIVVVLCLIGADRVVCAPTAYTDRDGLYVRPAPPTRPGPTIEAYVRPEFAARMRRLRNTILAAAARHNHPQLSGMSDREFAIVMATILYNENFGWAEELAPPLRMVTPLYQEAQQQVNSGIGANFSVWPANLRPSVAVEILAGEVPLADGSILHIPLQVEGSQIDLRQYHDQRALFAAITTEISHDELAINYLAANLERGVWRAAIEGQPISWRTLAAWHNQGIVDPVAIQANPTARDYVRRAAAYLPVARMLFATTDHAEMSAL